MVKREHIEVRKNLKFGVNQANIEKLQQIKNLKLIYKGYIDCLTHRPDVYIFLIKFWSF